MKKSIKNLAFAFTAIALFSTVNLNAQSPKLGLGINLGVPSKDYQSLAIAADLRYQFDVDKQLSIPLTAGYTHFFGKEINNTGIDYADLGYIPVKAGLKYFFNTTGSGVYGLGEIGAGFGTKSGTGTAFIFSPAIGYSWSNGLDLAAKYEGYSNNGTNGYTGLRLAYGFKL
jgi:hypothetical protein